MKLKSFLLFAAVLFSVCVHAQNMPEQDCIGGIHVCQSSYSQTSSYTGYGPTSELDGTNEGCLVGGEIDDVWYIVTVTSPGTLAFDITPNAPNTDYDFAVWDITGQGCSSIYNYSSNTTNPYAPVRCNASGNTGTTGLSSTACCPSQGAGNTPNYSSSITATVGQVFAICVNNWTANGSGYTIDFSPSTASIYDTVRPFFDSVASYCGATDSIAITMSEAVTCSSLAADGSDFYVTPNNGTPTAATGLTCIGTGTSSSSIGIKFSNPLPPGNYTLHAQNGTDGNTVLDGCGNAQLTSDSINFTILTPPQLTIPGPDTICINDSVQLHCTVQNPISGVTYTYLWNPNQYINDNTLQNPTVAPINTTTYTVTVHENSQEECVSTGSVDVMVLHGFTLNNHDTTICKGATIQMSITGDAAYHYSWTPTSGVNAVSNPNIMEPTASPLSNTTYTVTASFPGCPDSTLSFNATVGINPSITASADTTTCINDSVQLHVYIGNPNPNFGILWTPNQYISNDTSSNPYVYPRTATDYVVTVTDNSVGAACSISDTVHVAVLQGFTIVNHDTSICKGASVQINVLGDFRYNYNWTPNQWLSSGNIPNPVATPDSSITYKLIASYPGCRDSVQYLNIDVQPTPIPNAGGSAFKCEWDSLKLPATVSPSYPGYIYSWTPAGQLNDPTLLTPLFYGDTSTTLYLTVTTPAGCTGEDSLLVTVWKGNFGAISADTSLCPGDSTMLTASGGMQYDWTPPYTLNDAAIANPIATPKGTTDYTVIIKDIHDCPDTQTVRVTVFPHAVVDLPDTVTIYPGESYQMNPLGNGLYFSWFPPLGLSATNISNPVASPDVNTKYIVNVATEEGCTTIDSVIVNVSPESILTLPNAFTPGNGPNSVLQIIKRGQATLKYFRVFNRWGVQVFETTNIDEGWDGTYKGTPQPMGVYVYTIEAVTTTGRMFQKQGNVTLLR